MVVKEGDQGVPAAGLDAAAGVDLDSVKDTPLGITEGPLKNYATIGDALKGLTELASQHSKTSGELKTALKKITELSPKAKAAADSPKGAELWDKGVAEFNQNGKVSVDTMRELEQMTGISGFVWQRAVGVMKDADAKFSEETQKVLGVDSAGFQKMLDEAGVSDTYQDFIQDQIFNGRYGFLADVADDLRSRGIAKAPDQQPGEEQGGNQNQQQPGGQGAQGGQDQGGQVEMGQPPAQKRQQGWETEAAHQFDVNDAILAEKAGDPSKMEALNARMETLEAAGIEPFPDAPAAVTLG